VAENERPRTFKFPANHKRFYFSADLKMSDNAAYVARSVDISLVDNHILDTKGLISSGFDTDEFANAIFICKDGYIYQGKSYSDDGEPSPVDWSFQTYPEVEKMSKSKRNVVNPDDIIVQYGADTLRMYEMFLGPLEDSKPWDTKGIEGVHRFLQKLWRLFHENGVLHLSDQEPTEAELKVLHRTIKKITDDIERFSFNTCVSAFMICVNELQTLKCRKIAILAPLVRLLAPFAPHITERLWELFGNEASVHLSSFPAWEAQYLVDDSFDYPIQENGKMRFNLTMPKQASKEELEQLVLQNERVTQLAAGRHLKKIIVVPGRIVNLVY
jgi:leucyl-tRNA synthetase